MGAARDPRPRSLPSAGEHTADILTNLGLGAQEIAALAADRII
jgi:crotonobetainyl-CoA:carnitine CoA-transferase CaiB-like acyl-CoA transferase